MIITGNGPNIGSRLAHHGRAASKKNKMKKSKYFLNFVEAGYGLNKEAYFNAIQKLKDEGFNIRSDSFRRMIFTTHFHYIDSDDATILRIKYPDIMLAREND